MKISPEDGIGYSVQRFVWYKTTDKAQQPTDSMRIVIYKWIIRTF
jgi:hypothetical protein